MGLHGRAMPNMLETLSLNTCTTYKYANTHTHTQAHTQNKEKSSDLLKSSSLFFPTFSTFGRKYFEVTPTAEFQYHQHPCKGIMESSVGE
jgi:hypothetical protein